MFALYTITIAVSLFVMPVIYHHLQYPYKDVDKFKKRSHGFISFGLIPAGVTLYLSLELGIELGLRLHLSAIDDRLAFILYAIPFALVFIIYKKRK